VLVAEPVLLVVGAGADLAGLRGGLAVVLDIVVAVAVAVAVAVVVACYLLLSLLLLLALSFAVCSKAYRYDVFWLLRLLVVLVAEPVLLVVGAGADLAGLRGGLDVVLDIVVVVAVAVAVAGRCCLLSVVVVVVALAFFFYLSSWFSSLSPCFSCAEPGLTSPASGGASAEPWPGSSTLLLLLLLLLLLPLLLFVVCC